MIPKIIHYCWLSGEEYPELYKNCINSWSILNDYEFILWDYNKCKDIIENIPFVKRAYDSKAYAYVADYIRLYALYNYGGIYLDCDVQIVKKFDDLLHLPMFWCQENEQYIYPVECAVIGAEKNNDFFNYLLNYYNNYNEDIIHVMPNIIGYYGTRYFSNGIKIIDKIEDYDVNDKNTFYRFTKDYFSPKSFVYNNINITDNTYAIHLFNSGWKSETGLYEIVGDAIKFYGAIHTVNIIWLGENPIYDKYFSSIEKFLPNFKIKIWRDNDCINYINECKYAKYHYEHKHYAFVSDYLRFRILHDFGGMYIDTDVEFIRNIDDIISKGSFLAIEKSMLRVASGLIMYFDHKNNDCLKKCIYYYNKYYEDKELNDSCIIIDGDVLAASLINYGYKLGDFNQKLTNNISIYDSSYFNGTSLNNENTRAIHHYTNFWRK